MTDQINADLSQLDPPQYEWQNPKPQFDVGRVLGRTFSTLKNNYIKFGLLAFFVMGLPMFFLGLWPLLIGAGEGLLSDSEYSGTLVVGSIVASTLGVFLYFFLYLIVQAVLIHACFKDFAGERVSLKASVKTALASSLPLIGLMILYTLGVTMGFILFVIPGIFLFLGWYICIPVLVVEKCGVIASFGRSWALTKGYKRWILLLAIILWIITIVISTVLTLTSIPFGNPTTAALTGGSAIFWIVYAFFSAVAQAISVLINTAAVASIYYEVRDLKEGITPESIASVFD